MALWTVALNSEGQRINIEHAHRHEIYTCVNCGEMMMVKKGQEREHHFCHHSVTEKCDHDGWLHKEVLKLFISRLELGDSMQIDTPDGIMNLVDNLSFSKEKKYEGFVPDILIERAGEILFVEVCVTCPCSEEKINSGYKIIEIITEDARVIDELRTGPIHQDAQFYKLEFYNFDSQKGTIICKTEQTDTPDIISSEDERHVGAILNSSKNNDKGKSSEADIPYCPQVNAFSGKSVSLFILHADGMYEVKQQAEFCNSDILVLGVQTIPDFALNIGKAYAWRKGLLDVRALSKYEQHIDLPAVISSFGVVELNRSVS